ncbi:SIMPL domain-containing protein [Pseudoalteromonas fenneropenaei]|uniref:SIMPL domain-containing protein n=1 Tax=Pseudoalteromonas fenneropenaei TaxID=1737459 RepID=A0ABV7CEX5_9GAMM
MNSNDRLTWWGASALLSVAVVVAAFVVKDTALTFKAMERTVVVKGLAEQEFPADTVLWPLVYRDADNDLAALVARVEQKNQAIKAFLTLNGFADTEVSFVAPSITDKLAQEYSQQDGGFRYVAKSGMTVYSKQPHKVKNALRALGDLAKQGIAITQSDYDNRIEYLFTQLNDIKPDMVQAATREARAVADKFAKDSDSKLGKIKQANQGQFSIRERDSNTPEIKVVRVVTSVEYYLSD